MFRLMRGMIRVVLAASLLAGVAMVGAARGQTPTDPPPSEGPRRPAPPRFQRPPIPRRPGFNLPERPGFPRTPSSPRKPPEYMMEVTGSKHVVGVYQSQVYTSRVAAEQWEVYFPAAMELPRQTSAHSSMEPAGDVIREMSREHRGVLRARIATENPHAPQVVNLTVRYEATLLARRMVPIQPGAVVAPVAPLDMFERMNRLASTPTLNYRSEEFQAWLDKHGFRRASDEGEVDFARRVFLGMLGLFAYRDGIDPAPVSRLCTLDVLDCDTLSLTFTAAMRAGGVPARVVYGWPLRSIRHSREHPLSGHTQAEFFVDGVGWAPVDLVYGILHRADNPLANFAQDRGELLIVQVDPDYVVPHPDGNAERIVSLHPGPSSWAHSKSAKPDVAIRPVSWDVSISPGS